MKKLAFAAIFICMFILCGCPVLTQNSMYEGSYKVPSWLAGTWKLASKTGSETTSSYYIEAVKGKTGNILVYSVNSSGVREKTGRKCTVSDIGRQAFLSAYDAGDDEMNDPGWYIHKFEEISKNEFELIPVKEYAISYEAEPAEIKSYLLENKDND